MSRFSPSSLGQPVPSGTEPNFSYNLFGGLQAVQMDGQDKTLRFSLPNEFNKLDEDRRERDEIANLRLFGAVDEKFSSTVQTDGFKMPVMIGMKTTDAIPDLETVGEQAVNLQTTAGSGVRGWFGETNREWRNLQIKKANNDSDMYAWDANDAYNWAGENLSGRFGTWVTSALKQIAWIDTSDEDNTYMNLEGKLKAKAEGWDATVARDATTKFLQERPQVARYLEASGIDATEFTQFTKNPFAWVSQINEAMIAAARNRRLGIYEENTGVVGEFADNLYYSMKDPTMARDLLVSTLASYGFATTETFLGRLATTSAARQLGIQASLRTAEQTTGTLLTRGLSGGPLTGPIESLLFNTAKALAPSVGQKALPTLTARAVAIFGDASVQASLADAATQKEDYRFKQLLFNAGLNEYKQDDSRIYESALKGGLTGLAFFGSMRVFMGGLGDIQSVRSAAPGERMAALGKNIANSMDGFASTTEGRTIFGNKLSEGRGIAFGNWLDNTMRGIDNRNTASVLVNGKSLYHFAGFSPEVVSKANFNEEKSRVIVDLWRKVTNTVETPEELFDPAALEARGMTYDDMINILEMTNEAVRLGVEQRKNMASRGLFDAVEPYGEMDGRVVSRSLEGVETDLARRNIRNRIDEFNRLRNENERRINMAQNRAMIEMDDDSFSKKIEQEDAERKKLRDVIADRDIDRKKVKANEAEIENIKSKNMSTNTVDTENRLTNVNQRISELETLETQRKEQIRLDEERLKTKEDIESGVKRGKESKEPLKRTEARELNNLRNEKRVLESLLPWMKSRDAAKQRLVETEARIFKENIEQRLEQLTSDITKQKEDRAANKAYEKRVKEIKAEVKEALKKIPNSRDVVFLGLTDKLRRLELLNQRSKNTSKLSDVEKEKLNKELEELTDFFGGPEGVKEEIRARVIEDTLNNKRGFGTANALLALKMSMDMQSMFNIAESNGISTRSILTDFFNTTKRQPLFSNLKDRNSIRMIIRNKLGKERLNSVESAAKLVEETDKAVSVTKNGAVVPGSKIKSLFNNIIGRLDKREGDGKKTVLFVTDRDLTTSDERLAASHGYVKITIDENGVISTETKLGSLELKDDSVSMSKMESDPEMTADNTVDVATFLSVLKEWYDATNTAMNIKDAEAAKLLQSTLAQMTDQMRVIVSDASRMSDRISRFFVVDANASKDQVNTMIDSIVKTFADLSERYSKAKNRAEKAAVTTEALALSMNLERLKGELSQALSKFSPEEAETKASMEKLKQLDSTNYEQKAILQRHSTKQVKGRKAKKEAKVKTKKTAEEKVVTNIDDVIFDTGDVTPVVEGALRPETQTAPVKASSENLRLIFGFSPKESVVASVIIKSLGARLVHGLTDNIMVQKAGEALSQDEFGRIFFERLNGAAKAIISAGEGADLFTITHEMGHYARFMFLDPTVSAEARAKIGITPELFDRVMNWLGVEKNPDGSYKEITKTQEEKFANGIAVYIARLLNGEGKATNTGIQFAFNKIGEHLGNMGEKFKSGLDTEGVDGFKLSPEADEIFGQILKATSEDNITAIFEEGFRELMQTMDPDTRNLLGEKILGKMKWESWKATQEKQKIPVKTAIAEVVETVARSEELEQIPVNEAVKPLLQETPAETVPTVEGTIQQIAAQDAADKMEVKAKVEKLVYEELKAEVDSVVRGVDSATRSTRMLDGVYGEMFLGMSVQDFAVALRELPADMDPEVRTLLEALGEERRLELASRIESETRLFESDLELQNIIQLAKEERVEALLKTTSVRNLVRSLGDAVSKNLLSPTEISNMQNGLSRISSEEDIPAFVDWLMKNKMAIDTVLKLQPEEVKEVTLSLPILTTSVLRETPVETKVATEVTNVVAETVSRRKKRGKKKNATEVKETQEQQKTTNDLTNQLLGAVDRLERQANESAEAAKLLLPESQAKAIDDGKMPDFSFLGTKPSEEVLKAVDEWNKAKSKFDYFMLRFGKKLSEDLKKFAKLQEKDAYKAKEARIDELSENILAEAKQLSASNKETKEVESLNFKVNDELLAKIEEARAVLGITKDAFDLILRAKYGLEELKTREIEIYKKKLSPAVATEVESARSGVVTKPSEDTKRLVDIIFRSYYNFLVESSRREKLFKIDNIQDLMVRMLESSTIINNIITKMGKDWSDPTYVTNLLESGEFVPTRNDPIHNLLITAAVNKARSEARKKTTTETVEGKKITRRETTFTEVTKEEETPFDVSKNLFGEGEERGILDIEEARDIQQLSMVYASLFRFLKANGGEDVADFLIAKIEATKNITRKREYKSYIRKLFELRNAAEGVVEKTESTSTRQRRMTDLEDRAESMISLWIQALKQKNERLGSALEEVLPNLKQTEDIEIKEQPKDITISLPQKKKAKPRSIDKGLEMINDLKTGKGRWFALVRKLQTQIDEGAAPETIKATKEEMSKVLASVSIKRKTLKALGISEEFSKEDLAVASRLLAGLSPMDSTTRKLGQENARRILLDDILEITDDETKIYFLSAFRDIVKTRPEVKPFLRELEKIKVDGPVSKAADSLGRDVEEENKDPRGIRDLSEPERRDFIINQMVPKIIETLGNRAGPQNILSKFFHSVPGGAKVARQFQRLAGGGVGYMDTANSPFVTLAFLAKILDPNIDVRDGELSGKFRLFSMEEAEAEAKMILTGSGMPEVLSKIQLARLSEKALEELNVMAWEYLHRPSELPKDLANRNLALELIEARNKYNKSVSEYLNKYGMAGSKLQDPEAYGTSHKPSLYALNNPEEFVAALTKHETNKFLESDELNAATLHAMGWIELTRAKNDASVNGVIIREDSPIASLFDDDMITKADAKRPKKIKWGAAKRKLMRVDKEGNRLLDPDVEARYKDALVNVTEDYTEAWREFHKNFENPTAIFMSMRVAKDRILRVPEGESHNKDLMPKTPFANKASDYTEERLFTHEELVNDPELSKFYSKNILGLTIEETNVRLFQHVVTKKLTDLFGIKLTFDDLIQFASEVEKNYIQNVDDLTANQRIGLQHGLDKIDKSWKHKTQRLGFESSDYDPAFKWVLENAPGFVMAVGGISAGIKTVAGEVTRALLSSDRNRSFVTQFVPNLANAFLYGLAPGARQRRLDLLRRASAIHWSRAILEDTFSSHYEHSSARHDYTGPVLGRQGWWKSLSGRWKSLAEANRMERSFSDKANNTVATLGWLGGGLLRWSNEMVNVISMHNILHNIQNNVDNFRNLSMMLDKYGKELEGYSPRRKEFNRLARSCGLKPEEALDLSRSGLLDRETIDLIHTAVTKHYKFVTTEGLLDSSKLLKWAETTKDPEKAKNAVYKLAGYIKTLSRNTNVEPTLLDTRVMLDPVARALRVYTQFGTSNSVQAIGRVRRSGNVAVAKFLAGQLLMNISGGLLMAYLLNAGDDEEMIQELKNTPVAFLLSNVAKMPVYGNYGWLVKTMLTAGYGTYAHFSNEQVPDSVGSFQPQSIISSPFQYRMDSITKDVYRLPGMVGRYMEGKPMSTKEKEKIVDSLPLVDNLLIGGMLRAALDEETPEAPVLGRTVVNPSGNPPRMPVQATKQPTPPSTPPKKEAPTGESKAVAKKEVVLEEPKPILLTGVSSQLADLLSKIK